MGKLQTAFKEELFIRKIRSKLPYLFQMAEIDCSRAGKLGMEIGLVRERILIAMLIYKFGLENVDVGIPATEPEIDVKVFDKPISIKTITNPRITGIKLIWTVDSKKVKEFKTNYTPASDILLTHINWNNKGSIFLIPLHVQSVILKKLSRKYYFKLPKLGTNPRGVELSKEAVQLMINHADTVAVEINWVRRGKLNSNTYNRWLKYWQAKD